MECGGYVQGSDQAYEDFYGGTLPLHKRKKEGQTFPRKRLWGRRPELKMNESLRRISENNDWCVGNEAGKLGKAERQNPGGFAIKTNRC